MENIHLLNLTREQLEEEYKYLYRIDTTVLSEDIAKAVKEKRDQIRDMLHDMDFNSY